MLDTLHLILIMKNLKITKTHSPTTTKRTKPLHGGATACTAQANLWIDAATAEKGRFRMDTA
jgi:hypothetical protein